MLLEPSIGPDFPFSSTPAVSSDAGVVVVGVVWRRVKRILFVVGAAVTFPLASIVSQAVTQMEEMAKQQKREKKSS